MEQSQKKAEKWIIMYKSFILLKYMHLLRKLKYITNSRKPQRAIFQIPYK